MGWNLARRAHKARLVHLSPRARLVLDFMCWSALDEPQNGLPAATYWGGHVALMAHLFDLDDVGTNTAEVAIKRAVRELVAAGVIERTYTGHQGRASAYRVMVDGLKEAPAMPVENSPKPVENSLKSVEKSVEKVVENYENGV